MSTLRERRGRVLVAVIAASLGASPSTFAPKPFHPGQSRARRLRPSMASWGWALPWVFWVSKAFTALETGSSCRWASARAISWDRPNSIANLQDEIGDLLYEQGDLDGALAAFRATIAPLEELEGNFPGIRPRLGRSHRRIGDILGDQGDLDGMRAAFRASLAIDYWFNIVPEAPDPSLLAASYERVGVALRDKGDREEARSVLRAGLAIREWLAARGASGTSTQRDPSRDSASDILRDRGELRRAAYSVAVAERLAELGLLSEVSPERPDNPWVPALGARLAVAERLAEKDPLSAPAQREFCEIGKVFRDRADLDVALAACRAGLAIAERRAARAPSSVSHHT